MNALQFFLVQYDTVQTIIDQYILKGLSDDQWRYAPHEGQNSLAWLLWHTARTEDVAMTVLAGKGVQVMSHDKWLPCMNLTRRDVGTAMTVEECTEFNANIDLNGLRAYRAAVKERTQTIVASLTPEQLEEMAEPIHVQQTFADGTIGSERARWLEQFFANHTKAWWLGFVVWHNAEHVGEAFCVRSQAGIPVGV
jgi:uncharacterized damage-inducible protein DinB